jgi:hypothetical protein
VTQQARSTLSLKNVPRDRHRHEARVIVMTKVLATTNVLVISVIIVRDRSDREDRSLIIVMREAVRHSDAVALGLNRILRRSIVVVRGSIIAAISSETVVRNSGIVGRNSETVVRSAGLGRLIARVIIGVLMIDAWECAVLDVLNLGRRRLGIAALDRDILRSSDNMDRSSGNMLRRLVAHRDTIRLALRTPGRCPLPNKCLTRWTRTKMA